jgi:hypothetical protein
MRTRVPAPVCVPGTTCTPAAREVSRSATPDTAVDRTMSEASTCAIALPTSTRRCCPVAVVTTGLSETATCRIRKSSVAACPAVTVTCCRSSAKPMRRTRISTWPGATARSVYCPSLFVIVATVVPTTVTCADWTGWPLIASVTRPVTLPVGACAPAGAAALAATSTVDASARRRLRLFMDTSLAVAVTGRGGAADGRLVRVTARSGRSL